MVRKAGSLSPTDEARLFHQALLEQGVLPGKEIARQTFDDMIIAVFEVAHPSSITTKIRVGQALRLWVVKAAHGKGGRGHVKILDPTQAWAPHASQQATAVPA